MWALDVVGLFAAWFTAHSRGGPNSVVFGFLWMACVGASLLSLVTTLGAGGAPGRFAWLRALTGAVSAASAALLWSPYEPPFQRVAVAAVVAAQAAVFALLVAQRRAP